VPLLDKLFGRVRDAAAAEASLYGDFVIGAEVTVKALREAYDLPPTSAPDGDTLAELFRREFRNDLELGDRLHVGPVDLIVRDMRDGKIGLVGIALDPRPPEGWEKVRVKLAGWLKT